MRPRGPGYEVVIFNRPRNFFLLLFRNFLLYFVASFFCYNLQIKCSPSNKRRPHISTAFVTSKYGNNVLGTFIAHSLDCIKCEYNSSTPSAQQVCNSSVVKTCTLLSTYCDSLVYTNGDTTYYNRGCSSAIQCGSPTTYCNALISSSGYKACKITCCQSNSCNNKFPSLSDNGVDHTKVGQAAFIVGLVAAILFAWDTPSRPLKVKTNLDLGPLLGWLWLAFDKYDVTCILHVTSYLPNVSPKLTKPSKASRVKSVRAASKHSPFLLSLTFSCPISSFYCITFLEYFTYLSYYKTPLGYFFIIIHVKSLYVLNFIRKLEGMCFLMSWIHLINFRPVVLDQWAPYTDLEWELKSEKWSQMQRLDVDATPAGCTKVG